MRYVLSAPKGCQCLRLTRPIEKVERTTTVQVFMLVFDVINMAFFIIAASYNQHLRLLDSVYMREEIAILANTIFFGLSILFYCLTLIDPGYVQTKRDFLGLMERIISEELHLDYVCINCENLRPENTRHCNYCNRCVQGFDHHCTFVNNCLGYRNHKFFLLFLLCFTCYMCALIWHCIFGLAVIASGKGHNETDIRMLKVFIDCYLLLVVAFHAPIICLQNYAQMKKLCKRNPIPDPNFVTEEKTARTKDHEALTTVKGSLLETGTQFDRQTVRGYVLPPLGTAFFYNLKRMFSYKPQSQEELYRHLFDDSIASRSTKSLQMQARAPPPLRHELETSVWQQTNKTKHGSPTPSLTGRGTDIIPPSQNSLTGVPVVEGSFTESASSSLQGDKPSNLKSKEFNIAFDQDQTFDEQLRQKMTNSLVKPMSSEVNLPSAGGPASNQKQEEAIMNQNRDIRRNSGNINWTLSNRTDSKRMPNLTEKAESLRKTNKTQTS